MSIRAAVYKALEKNWVYNPTVWFCMTLLWVMQPHSNGSEGAIHQIVVSCKSSHTFQSKIKKMLNIYACGSHSYCLGLWYAPRKKLIRHSLTVYCLLEFFPILEIKNACKIYSFSPATHSSISGKFQLETYSKYAPAILQNNVKMKHKRKLLMGCYAWKFNNLFIYFFIQRSRFKPRNG